MKYIADLHVHSKYSRATSKDLDLESLYTAARIKGVNLVGTGDFTHPAWFAHIEDALEAAEPGLFKLKDDIETRLNGRAPESCPNPVRFILQTEISSIYKKDGVTRKNHNLVFIPDTESAKAFNERLDKIGNIASDGRPILGLDAKHLLEILLDTVPDGFLIPAHIWTPWFSLLGSKSGFDSLEDCFEDLSGEIFAAETGLSSDPFMNRRVSGLDRLTLVSDSDAHSAFTLGRNANIFNTELSFFALKSALKTGNTGQCLGTIDLYPEEGKYHFDGHRKCNVCLNPAQAREQGGVCPECGKPLTLGVLHRVEELADRDPESRFQTHPCYHIIPLAEILSELYGVGPKSKKVEKHYQSAVSRIGPEMDILLFSPEADLDRSGIPMLREAVSRMRAGKVIISPGFDGEYGKITLFDPDERDRLTGVQPLFDIPSARPEKPEQKTIFQPKPKKQAVQADFTPVAESVLSFEGPDYLSGLNENQKRAVLHGDAPLLIIAGPGAGKTRTLTRRIAYLIRDKQQPPESVLAVTFTNKAALEMRERLNRMIGDSAGALVVATFHGLCLNILHEQMGTGFQIVSEDERDALIAEAIRLFKSESGEIKPDLAVFSDLIVSAKQSMLDPCDDLGAVCESGPPAGFQAVYQIYQALLSRERRFDFDDLIVRTNRLFSSEPEIRRSYAERFQYVFVDEYQDLNYGQYLLVKALSPEGRRLFAIGDPDQSIYGFRGSSVKYFKSFIDDFPGARTVRLDRNYRSTETILEASHQVISRISINPGKHRIRSGVRGVKTLSLMALETEKAEAVAIGKTIESMIGGIGFHSIDFQKTGETGSDIDLSFSDIAVLFRTKAQGRILHDVFLSAGFPCRMVQRDALYAQKDAAGLLSWLKLSESRGMPVDMERAVNVSDSGIGKTIMNAFKSYCHARNLPFADALASFPDDSGADAAVRKAVRRFSERLACAGEEIQDLDIAGKLNRLRELTALDIKSSEAAEAVEALIKKGSAFGNQIDSFLASVNLQTDPDMYDGKAQKITLMTMHAAKGLEFPVVFIAGCENGIIPYRYGPKNRPADIDEERRLFYVAMTRAEKRLYLTRARRRRIFGRTVETEPSPFIDEIRTDLLKLEKNESGRKQHLNEQIQLSLF